MKKICLITGIMLCTAFCFGKSFWANSNMVDLLDKPSFKGKMVAKVNYGTELIDSGTQIGHYIKVTVAGKEELTGWVHDSQISYRKIKTTSSATAKEISLAGKGFSAEIEKLYGSNSNLDFEKVDLIEKIEIDYDALDAFIEEGNLNEQANKSSKGGR